MAAVKHSGMPAGLMVAIAPANSAESKDTVYWWLHRRKNSSEPAQFRPAAGHGHTPVALPTHLPGMLPCSVQQPG